MNVLIIPMLSDNFCYYLHRKEDISKGFFVDVSEPEKVYTFLKTFGIPAATHLITTHKHGDHSGGNLALKEMFPDLQIIGGANDNIPGVTHAVNDGDVLDLHGVKIKCFHTPCHTRGHILYYCESPEEEKIDHEVTKTHGYQDVKAVNRCIFTGDTIFVGGCGRFFEGTADQMLSAMDRVSVLPPDTKLFCGHEYTVKNLEFGIKAEPKNEFLAEKYKFFSELNANGFWTVPSLLRDELEFNVFMRCRTP